MRIVAILSALLAAACHPKADDRPSTGAPAGAAVEVRGPIVDLLRAGAAEPPGATGAEVRGALAELLRAERQASARAPGASPSLAVTLAYYEHRGDAPAWCVGPEPLRRGQAIVAAIEGLEEDGLHPADYLAEVKPSLERAAQLDPAALARLEFELTRALLGSAGHLLHGRTDPLRIHPEWSAPKRSADIFAQLDQAATDASFASLIRAWRPEAVEYARLLGALAAYRKLAAAGDWARIPGPAPFEISAKRGASRASSRQQELLRARLLATGDLPAGAGSDLGELRAAVAVFQGRHGQEPTGIVDEATLDRLNVPASRRVAQLEANLERWRWLPADLGRRHVRVNIAGFEVRGFEDGKSVLEMRAVVGKTYRRTPVYSGLLTEVVLNPRWSVPHKLAYRDILPKVQEDPSYLERMGLQVYAIEDGKERRIDGRSVDWRALDGRGFPYKLRQEAGRENALGTMKFVFDNPYDVYLHDTPKRGAFAREERAQSSGCVRLERPLDLAAFLLAPAPEWSREAIKAAIGREQTRNVPLPEAVPVHLLYKTAWVDEEGIVSFRRDLYGRDALLIEALSQPLPAEPR